MGIPDGHRARIRERLSKGNVLNHEILEILLFNAVPRRNTNELAHRLLAEFGSVARIFSASMDELQRVEGIGESLASYICTIGLCYEQYYDHRVRSTHTPMEYDKNTFLGFVKEAYEMVNREVLDVYALDENRNILSTERFSQDSLFNAEAEPEALAAFLSRNHACGLVIVHNHPLGRPEPSDKDDYMTMKCQLICSMQNVLLCDHIIYAPSGLYSYYHEGRLKNITERYSVQNVLKNAIAKDEV